MVELTFPSEITNLDTPFSLQQGNVTFADSNMEIITRLFDGTMPGPTVRVKPGDTLNVAFTNDLTDQGLNYTHNAYSAPDETNLHFHGLHVSGELPSDDVTYVVRPQAGYDYTIDIPEYHMPGTHWIHPHRHGSTTLQVGGGAVSALIVEDPEGSLPTQVEDATEILFLVQYMNVNQLRQVASTSNDLLFEIRNPIQNIFLMVNGQVNPTITIDAGKWMRFRIIFANWFNNNLNFDAQGCEMQLLAKDGIYIQDYPRSISNAPIPPGGRADIMVRCMDPSTNYTIVGMGNPIATISTTDSSVTSVGLRNWTYEYPDYLDDLQNEDVSDGCSCDTSMGNNAINTIPFDGNILHTTYLGSIAERNLFGTGHPYHQHVYPFQLKANYDDGEYYKHGDWHDVILGGGTVRFAPTVFTGKLMMHCHRLVHEDQGMMALENVTDGDQCTCTGRFGQAPTTTSLSDGAIAGIVVGSIAFVGISLFAARKFLGGGQGVDTPETESGDA